MDDLLQGYIVFDAVGDFLNDCPPVDRPKQPAMTPQSKRCAQRLNPVPPMSGLDQNGQGAVVSNGRVEASKGVRQRRGHTKSRLGCIACKKRKIKCQEKWPSCANCDKRGILCRYPDIFKHGWHELAGSNPPSPRQIVQLSDTPIVYSPEDMQLFHHYLTAAYPCVPHNYETVWIRDVPLKSHQYSYLMDAMLALAGSHLSIQVENPNNNLALRHRQKAIVSLENAFARWPPTADESHVMFAASMLLCLQSNYMDDGFLEHFISLRGCSLLSQLIVAKGFKGPFVEQTGQDLVPVDTSFENLLQVDQDLLRGALLSLKGFSNLVSSPNAHPIEKAIVGQLAQTLRCLLRSDVQLEGQTSAVPHLPDTNNPSQPTPATNAPSNFIEMTNPLLPTNLADVFHDIDWESITTPPAGSPLPLGSFQAMVAILTIFSTWPQEALFHIFDPKNHLSNVIMAHFSAIRFILSALAAPEDALRAPIRAVVQWSAKFIAAIDDDDKSGEWAQYVELPRKIIRCVQICVEKNRGYTMADLRDLYIRDPGAFKEGRAPRL